MPTGLSQDLALISNNENLSVNPEMLPFAYLMVSGGTPWDDLKPAIMETQSTTYSSTETENGYTFTDQSSDSSTYSGDGTPDSSGGGEWSINYQDVSTSTGTVSGTNSSGQQVTSTASDTVTLSWQAWGDNGGPTNYKVTQDVTQDNSSSTTADPFDEEQDVSGNSQLMAEGVVDASGNLESGDFTYGGNISNAFSLTDGSGSPSGPGIGYAVSYNASTAENLNESGDLIPDSNNQGGITINSSETGNISITDGQGGFDGVSRADADTVMETYAGSQPAASPSNPGTPTTGTVSIGGTQTQIPIPKGKNTVYVIDAEDKGWKDWPMALREAYGKAHGFDPNQNTTDGPAFLEALNPPNGYVNGGPGVKQVYLDLSNITSQSGQIDVLVIGDHGGPGNQRSGNDSLTPRLAPAGNTTLLDGLVVFMKPGGTLVLAGCDVFAPNPADPTNPQGVINQWQAYATAKNITIIGSVSPVWYSPGNTTGVWVTLTPGGTAPTITK